MQPLSQNLLIPAAVALCLCVASCGVLQKPGKRGDLKACQRARVPETPPRDAVLRALRNGVARVDHCMHGVMVVEMEFECTGHVRSLKLPADTKPSTRECVEPRLMEITVPMFRRETMHVVYPILGTR